MPETQPPACDGMTLAALKADALAALRAQGVETPEADLRALMSGVLGLSLTDMVTRSEQMVRAADKARFDSALRRRLAGEPVHRILGAREFYGLTFALSPQTLEPRPDTECLVEALAGHAASAAARNGTCRILDLGTGTGAIALSLLSLVDEAEALATDVSGEALATAQANAETLGFASRFAARKSDWFDDVDGRFDLIVSNPPYIESAAIEALAVEVRAHDPRRALDGGRDGLDAYRAIAAGARAHLGPEGIVGLEIGAGQRAAVTALFADRGLELVSVHRDLGGHERALVFAPAHGDGQAGEWG